MEKVEHPPFHHVGGVQFRGKGGAKPVEDFPDALGDVLCLGSQQRLPVVHAYLLEPLEHSRTGHQEVLRGENPSLVRPVVFWMRLAVLEEGFRQFLDVRVGVEMEVCHGRWEGISPGFN